jgi:hypothetical protein
MDELERFRDFRKGVAAPSEDARRRALTRLGGAVSGRRRPQPRIVVRRGYRWLALAAVVGAAVMTLFVSSPWTSSPGFLERAQAALTPPADSIVHFKWEVTSSFSSPACSVTRGPNEMWIDQSPPHTYRAILDDPPPAGADPRSLACASGTRREVGGTVDPACSPAEQANCTTMDTLEFEAPNTLRVSPLQFVLPPDPVAMLRAAIAAENAHHQGRTQLHGRTVERIRIDPVPLGGFDEVMASACAFPSCAFGDVYVDPETFYPVEMHEPPLVVVPPPEDGVGIGAGQIIGSAIRFDAFRAQVDVVDRYLVFEYLPRSEANLALTDIQAQHPDATVSEE